MQELEGYFKALADANRLRIINLLFYGELCGCDIQVVLETSQPNASRHLTYLKHAGLVRDRREGFRVFYGLIEPAPEKLRGLFDYLRTAFKDDRVLRDDLAHLKRAIRDGACTFQQIRPLPRLEVAS
ncbi:MAG TPA: metalloregulator ArsR/SmtB family transcription factor [Terriglobia bacterium]|jgi:ArsR family transcriptional regulator|nr:metalloregulator ArsR/SmtB family transcription factor [Terriglobia bacterium]